MPEIRLVRRNVPNFQTFWIEKQIIRSLIIFSRSRGLDGEIAFDEFLWRHVKMYENVVIIAWLVESHFIRRH